MSENKLLRVTQMNAIFLENEITKALLEIIQSTFRFLPAGFVSPYEPEINLLLQLSVLWKSIWQNGSTFGQQLLSIKYDNISTTKKCLYTICGCLEYVKQRFELWKPQHPINSLIFKIHITILMLSFFNMSVFLRNGVKPLLIERFLNLNHISATESASRHIESKYLARELLWSGFIDVLINILPLVNYHKLRRLMRHYNPFNKKATYVVVHNNMMTMHSKCAHCGEAPVLPHHMGCTHVFCYVCLKGNQIADSRYECPICEHRNPNILCDRVAVI